MKRRERETGIVWELVRDCAGNEVYIQKVGNYIHGKYQWILEEKWDDETLFEPV